MYRVVLALAWPVMAEMALQTLTQMVDMAMVGRLGATSIAAVGLSFRPLFIGHALFLGLGTAATALVARSTGAGERAQADHAATQALASSFALALSFGVGLWMWSDGIILAMGGSGDVVALGGTYLRGLAPGMVCMMMSVILSSSLRGAGDTRTPMQVNFVANVINVIGNYLLIFGHFGFPRLGVFGAAVATSIARAVALAFFLTVTIGGGRAVRILPGRLFRPDWDLIGRLFRVGLPAALNGVVLSVALAVHLRLVAGLGTVAVAAATLAGNVEQLSFMPALGFSVAAAALAGQSLGAGDPARARAAIWESTKLCSAFMGAMGLAFVLAPAWFLRLFTDDALVLGPGIDLLRIVALAQLPTAVGQVLAGGLRGAGDTASVLYITVISTALCRLSLTFLLVTRLGYGLNAAWLAVVVDWTLRALLAWWRFAAGNWQHVRV
ncbi:MAG TPA: MATE family efflux transporter [Clostridiales bacterium UBA8153]|nr:MATE family efflux transporter [Clostridiales bacterium UBA8153]